MICAIMPSKELKVGETASTPLEYTYGRWHPASVRIEHVQKIGDERFYRVSKLDTQGRPDKKNDRFGSISEHFVFRDGHECLVQCKDLTAGRMRVPLIKLKPTLIPPEAFAS